jgi:hypothetical protein
MTHPDCTECEAPYPFHVSGCTLADFTDPPDWESLGTSWIHNVVDFSLKMRGHTPEEIDASRVKRGLPPKN